MSNKNDEYHEVQFKTIIENERDVLNSGNKYLIRSKIQELKNLGNSIFSSNDKNFVGPFLHLKMIEDYPNQEHANKLKEEGKRALEKEQYELLKHVVYQLSALLPRDKEVKKEFNNKDKTGLR